MREYTYINRGIYLDKYGESWEKAGKKLGANGDVVRRRY